LNAKPSAEPLAEPLNHPLNHPLKTQQDEVGMDKSLSRSLNNIAEDVLVL
jgi:hypothetical protein